MLGGWLCIVSPWQERGSLAAWVPNCTASQKLTLVRCAPISRIDQLLILVRYKNVHSFSKQPMRLIIYIRRKLFMATSKACVSVYTFLFFYESLMVHSKSNVLIDDNGNARLSDFGLSRVLESTGLTTKSMDGTHRWMAYELMCSDDPEQDGTLTTASDIWSLGCTVIELLTGKPPYAEITNGMSGKFIVLFTSQRDKLI